MSTDEDLPDDPCYQSAPNMRLGVVEYAETDEYIAYRKCSYLEEVKRVRRFLVEQLGPCKIFFNVSVIFNC